MAGRKQHYIPQALLRGFEAARSGTKSQVFVFRKGRPPYLSSTEGVAAERDFYSNPIADGAGALDDRITDFENDHLTPILRELRSVESGDVDSETASIAVAHLAFRTAHLRGAMSNLVSQALTQTHSLFENRDALRRFAGADSLSPDSTMAATVRSELSRMGLDALPEKERKAAERIIVFRFRERFDDLVINATGSIREKLKETESTMPGTIAKAHARALSAGLVPQERLRPLKMLTWSVITADDIRQFILPDCVVVARSVEVMDLKPFATLSPNDAVLVIMPISSQRILVGSDSTICVDLNQLNQRLARTSIEFFVSSEDHSTTRSLADSIGTCTAGWKLTLYDEQISTLTDVAPEEVHAKKHLVFRVPSGKFGDDARKALARIAETTLETATAARIESVTVPANLAAALESVWNRKPTAEELSAAAFGTVEAVKPSNEWKCRVILPRQLVEALVQRDDPGRRLLAARLVKHNLGRAYYFDCVARSWPAVFDQHATDPWNQVVWRVALRAASSYFGGLASARHDSEPLPGGESLQELATIIRLGLERLSQARSQFFSHQDVDRLIVDAVNSIETMIVATASVCGFLEAKNTTISRESAAGMVLSEANLWDWSVLYAMDLRRHYEKRDRWSFEDEIKQHAQHVERLLWAIGVLVSDTGNGHWIDVLDDHRIPYLAQILKA